MSTLSVHISKPEGNAMRFCAVAGNRQSVGRTRGEALDTLLADLEDPLEATNVRIEPLPLDENVVEPHLIQVNGVWVIAGGVPMSEDASRDLVAESYEARAGAFHLL